MVNLHPAFYTLYLLSLTGKLCEAVDHTSSSKF
jgi:hypothetical protein